MPRSTEVVYVQHELVEFEGSAIQVVWLPRRKDVQLGSIISLKGDDRKWIVNEKWNLPKTVDELHKDWKVGGLA